MSTELNLLPCPFCGSEDGPHPQTQGNRARMHIVCPTCGCRGPFASMHDGAPKVAGLWNRRASPAAAVPEGALPPLPKPWQDRGNADDWKRPHNVYQTAEIAEWRARAAVAADRARQHQSGHMPPFAAPAGQQDAIATVLTEQEIYRAMFPTGYCTEKRRETARQVFDAISSALADRAQQGEPVAYMYVEDGETYFGRPDGYHPADAIPLVAATKAAAPDDAPKLELCPLCEKGHLLRMHFCSGCGVEVGISADATFNATTGATPVPDTGIPTAGECTRCPMSTPYGPAVCYECAEKELSGRAPASTTPTSGAVEEPRDEISDLKRQLNEATATAVRWAGMAGALSQDATLYQKLRAMHWTDKQLVVIDAADLTLGVQTYSGELLDAQIKSINVRDAQPRPQKQVVASLNRALGIGKRKPRPSPAAKQREINAGQVEVLERLLADIRKRSRQTPAWAPAYNSAATAVELVLADVKKDAAPSHPLEAKAGEKP